MTSSNRRENEPRLPTDLHKEMKNLRNGRNEDKITFFSPLFLIAIYDSFFSKGKIAL